MDTESSGNQGKSGSLGMKRYYSSAGETYGMNHTKPINKEFLEDDSNFYTAFTQYNLDEI